eukprot:921805-Rhodomonas_salina.2
MLILLSYAVSGTDTGYAAEQRKCMLAPSPLLPPLRLPLPLPPPPPPPPRPLLPPLQSTADTTAR